MSRRARGFLIKSVTSATPWKAEASTKLSQVCMLCWSGPRFSNTDANRGKGISGELETLMEYLKFSKYIPGAKTILADAR